MQLNSVLCKCHIYWLIQVLHTEAELYMHPRSLLPARRRPQGLVVIGVCLSVCLRARITAGMPGISPALVGCIPGSVVGKAVAAGDAVCPWLCH